MNLAGKVAIVTGGASGVGLAAAKKFRALVADVVIADINGDQANAVASEIGALAVATDVSKSNEIESLVQQTAERFGGLDILFNNAGVGFSSNARYKMASITETPDDAWDAILRINLRSVAMGCKFAIPEMIKRGGGSIVNNASIQAIAAVSGADAYTAAKGGIVSLTRVLASDWGPKNIRVNCICPGPIETPMINELLAQDEFRHLLIDPVPLNRAGTADEIAEVAVFLAGPGASYVNGVILPVDGGWSAR